jgi:N-acyl-D-amino-acid deacylase
MRKRLTRRSFIEKSSKIVALTGLGGWGPLLQGCSTKKDLDLVIKGGRVFDGLGNEPVTTDLGIKDGLIKELGDIATSRGVSVVEANGLAVCPGFVDAHDHTDVQLLVNPKAESSIRQGITTLVSGNCGSSPFPVAEEILEEIEVNLKDIYGLELTWRDIDGFFSKLEQAGIALNYSSLVGHGTIRGAAMGFNNRPPTEEELEKMKAMVSENLDKGALGISSGLVYEPGSFADKDEVTQLCTVAAQRGGVYATHMRNEDDTLIESLDETIETARRAGIPLQIAHFKVAYERNWDKIDEALKRVEKAKQEGIEIFCDRYPYIAGSTGLSYYFPQWVKEGTTEEFIARLRDPSLESRIREDVAEGEKKLGSWDKVLIASVVSDENKPCQGKSVLENAKDAGKTPYEFMRNLLVEEKGRVGMVTFMMSEENTKRILAHPLVGVGTDGSAVAPYGVLGEGNPHPRLYGTFPRALGKYVREEKIAPMQEMVKKMTSIPARRFGFEKRGALQPNHFADIVIFDEENVIDKATWTDPHQYSEGIEYVLVNGQIVIERGEHSGALPGKVLRKKATG